MIILRNVRIAYPHLFEPHAFQNNAPKYEATFMIPKDDEETIDLIKEEIESATNKKWGSKVPPNLRSPVKDGDELSTAAFDGHWIICARSKPRDGGGGRPGAVLPNLKPAEPDDIQSGDYVNADINAFGYDQGQPGVSFGLNNVQLCEKGDRIGGGRRRPENVFEELEVVGSPSESGGGGNDFFS